MADPHTPRALAHIIDPATTGLWMAVTTSPSSLCGVPLRGQPQTNGSTQMPMSPRCSECEWLNNQRQRRIG